jgi:hypothetical protein
MCTKAGIGYHGVASSIPRSDLPTLSVVGEGEVTIFIKTLTRACMKTLSWGCKFNPTFRPAHLVSSRWRWSNNFHQNTDKGMYSPEGQMMLRMPSEKTIVCCLRHVYRKYAHHRTSAIPAKVLRRTPPLPAKMRWPPEAIKVPPQAEGRVSSWWHKHGQTGANCLFETDLGTTTSLLPSIHLPPSNIAINWACRSLRWYTSVVQAVLPLLY